VLIFLESQRKKFFNGSWKVFNLNFMFGFVLCNGAVGWDRDWIISDGSY